MAVTPSPKRAEITLCLVLALGAARCSDEGSAGSSADLDGGSDGRAASAGGSVSSGGGPGSAGRNGGGGGSASGGASRGGAPSGGAPSGGAGAGGAASGGGPSGGAGGSAGSGGAIGGGCDSGDYLICEDFEDTEPGGTPEGWSKHGDASGVTASEARHGSRSLELGEIPVWERRIYHDASMLGSAHWGRLYYKVKLPVPDAFVHSTLAALGGVGPTTGPGEFRVVDTVKQSKDTPDVASRHQFLYNVQPRNNPEFGTGTSYDFTFDGEWHCAEWHVDSSNQSYEFFYDGAQKIHFEHGAGNYEGSDLPDSFDELRIGWINYQESPPGFTAWIDDVAVGNARIGCE